MEKTITLIRHGKTPGNYEKRYIGITDEPLSVDGEKKIIKDNYTMHKKNLEEKIKKLK